MSAADPGRRDVVPGVRRERGDLGALLARLTRADRLVEGRPVLPVADAAGAWPPAIRVMPACATEP